MEDITQSLNFSPQNKRTKQKISDELRKLIIDVIYNNIISYIKTLFNIHSV